MWNADVTTLQQQQQKKSTEDLGSSPKYFKVTFCQTKAFYLKPSFSTEGKKKSFILEDNSETLWID